MGFFLPLICVFIACIRAISLKTLLLGYVLYLPSNDCNKSTKLVVRLLLTDGQRVANSTLIDTLLEKDFKLVINDGVYNVCSPEKGTNTFLSVHTVSIR